MGGYSEVHGCDTDRALVARFTKCSDFVRERKVFVKNKTKVASTVGCSERAVLYFRELLFKSNKKKSSFRRVESEKIGSHWPLPFLSHILRKMVCYVPSGTLTLCHIE